MKCDKLIKEAFEGIEFRYKLDDTLEELGNQKLSSKQLEGFLIGKGVSPKEIKQSGVLKGFENDNRVMTGKEWLERSGGQAINTEGRFGYEDITLGLKGKDPESNYNVTAAYVKPTELPTNPPHFGHSEYYDEFGDEGVKKTRSLLGWRRTHTDTINGSKVTVLNELQSDWAQTERAGRGTFESNVKDTKQVDIELLRKNMQFKQQQVREASAELSKIEDDLKQHLKDADEIYDILMKDPNDKEAYYAWKEVRKKATMLKEYKKSRDYEKLVEDHEQLVEEMTKAKDELLSYKNKPANVFADFPMSEVKHTQYQIVGALDEAIKNGTNKVVIPIERENELVGTAGVTKFYDSLNKKILPEIRKKLEKQGMRIKVGKEEYSGSKDLPGVDTLLDEMLTFARDNDYDSIGSKIVDFESENGLIKSLNDLENWAKEFKYEDMLNDFLSTFGTKNSLHTLTIEEIPGSKVKWDVYALLGGLGLASQTKSEASTSTTFDITSKDKMPEKIKTMEGFMAKPYKPSDSSGITIGYGYDKLEKSWRQVRGDFNEAEIDEAKARAFYTNKDVTLSKEEATRLADVMWYKEGYQKLARIGLKPGELSEVIQNKIYSLAYRGDIVKNGDGYRGKIYDLIKSREFDKLDSFINSSATRAVVKKRWNDA